MLLITISDPCTYAILNDIVISYYYVFIVLIPVSDNIYLSYTLCHMSMSSFCVMYLTFYIYPVDCDC